ncbi:Cell division protein FtsA [Sporomusa carbonis]|uniref:cell division protein FtsA n=1 Tax=Sporomusa carbonis TaxID=3076075 RepID=UPI003A7A0C20
MDKKTILAIDVGTGMVKVFSGRQQADGSLQLLGSGAAPTAGYTRGTVTDVNALAHSIRQAVDCVAMAADNQAADSVYLGISGSMLVSQNSVGSVALASPGTVIPADVERACQAAVFAAAKNDHEVLHVFAVKESLVRAGAALEVETHIVTAPKAILQSLTCALTEVGICLNGIVSNVVTAAESMKSELPGQPANFIYMDIGAGTADFAVYVDRRLCLSASLPLGGDYITSDLMQGLSVSRAHAEEIKRYYSRLSSDLRNQGVILDCNDYGTTDKHIPFDFLYDIVESRVDEIVTLVYDYLSPLLKNYLSQPGQVFDGIYLTGGCGSMPSVAACVARVFQIHTEVIKPSRLAVEYAHPANAVCYGIINYGARKLPCESATSRSAWNVFVRKVKKILKFDRR